MLIACADCGVWDMELDDSDIQDYKVVYKTVLEKANFLIGRCCAKPNERPCMQQVQESLQYLAATMQQLNKRKRTGSNEAPYTDQRKDSYCDPNLVWLESAVTQKACINNANILVVELRTCQLGQWLCDEVLNGWLWILYEKLQVILPGRNFFFHSTFFYSQTLCKHNKYSYETVSRWSSKGKYQIGDLDKLFIPIHVRCSHWVLAVVNFEGKLFEFYDSSRGAGGREGLEGKEILQNIRAYVKAEILLHGSKRGVADIDAYVDHIPVDTPQQSNGSDCGVFLSIFCELIALNLPLTCTPTHANNMRNRIVREICLRGYNQYSGSGSTTNKSDNTPSSSLIMHSGGGSTSSSSLPN